MENVRERAASFRAPTERREQSGGGKGRGGKEKAEEERVEDGGNEGQYVEGA